VHLTNHVAIWGYSIVSCDFCHNILFFININYMTDIYANMGLFNSGFNVRIPPECRVSYGNGYIQYVTQPFMFVVEWIW
jgi:hypothetical protein